MKTKLLYALLILSLMLNTFSSLQITRLSRELQQQRNEFYSLANTLESRISNISSEFQESIDAKASLLESQRVTFGSLNPDTFTVPVQVTVTPKRLEKGAQTRLNINGQEAIMAPGPDYTLVGTVETSVFDELQPIIIFEQGSAHEIEKLEVYGPLRYEFLPNFSANFNGQIQNLPNTNRWRIMGDLYIALDPNTYQREVKSVKLVALTDGKPVKTRDLDLAMDITVPLNEEITLEKNQTFELMVVMEDIYGLTYEHYVDGFNLDPSFGASGNYNPGSQRITILRSDGTVMFTSEK